MTWKCRLCNVEFVRDEVCVTCGAEKLYDVTVKNYEEQIELMNTQLLIRKDLIEKLKSGPGGIMEMKQTIADKESCIEKLETALRHCINALRQYEMGDDRPRGLIPNDDLRPWLLGAMDNAKKVLEGKDD